MADRRTTCPFCGAGCGLYLEVEGAAVTGTYPSRAHSASAGRLCVRGWHAHEIASSPDRVRAPCARDAGGWAPLRWERALELAATRLREIVARHGPDAVAFLGSPRCSNEEAYLLQKLARAVVGTNAVDHGTGVCANGVAAPLLETLGVAASTCSFEDLDRSDVVVVDGVDLGRRLPTVAGRVLRAKLRGAKLVLIGERRHRLAEHAQLVLQLRPGTEAVLYTAMAKVVLDRGLVDAAFVRRCEGFEAFASALRASDLPGAAAACGLSARAIEDAALLYARARAATLLFSTAEPRPPEATRALAHLAMLAGQLGRAGAGLLALGEHNNLQGVCDVGLTPDLLPGYRPVSSAAARAELGDAWGAALPERPGPTAADVLRDRAGGHVRAVWLCRDDPVATSAEPGAAEALEGCELVIAQTVFPTETNRRAHLVLPVAAFGEEEVTFTSSERRVQLAPRVIEPPPGVLPAWRQLAELGRRLGAAWRYASAADVMAEIAAVAPAYGAIRHERLERGDGLQWPCDDERPRGTPTLLGPGDVPRRLRFGAPGAVPAVPAAPGVDPEHPLALVLGHSDHHWHRDALVQHSETLRREHRILLLDYPGGFVELNPADAAAAGVRDGDAVLLRSAAGAAPTRARVTGEVRPGAAFLPFFLHEIQLRLGAPPGAAVVPVRLERVAP